MSTHLAAISPAKGQSLELQPRPTPKPGPGELLIAVKSIALNPGDGLIRNLGLFIPEYPTVIGFDIAGLVLEVGDDVPTGSSNDYSDVSFQPGVTRVAALVASYWKSYDANYGAFQERCLVPWQHAVPILDPNMSWNHAATLPVAVEVPLCAWDAMGISWSRKTPTPASPSTEAKARNAKNEALLIWGASSSVGTMGVQSARLLREDPNSCIAAVYATAGAANKKYIQSLGADNVFDYKDSQVVHAIISSAREAGLAIRHCFLATGDLASCQAVLRAFLELDNNRVKGRAKIASAPVVPSDADVVKGIDTIFVLPSGDEKERLEQFRSWMGWLKENLAKGLIRPSPEPKVVGKGLGVINKGLDMVLEGVSCTKLVVEIEE